jgi:hypothetical protein
MPASALNVQAAGRDGVVEQTVGSASEVRIDLLDVGERDRRRARPGDPCDGAIASINPHTEVLLHEFVEAAGGADTA